MTRLLLPALSLLLAGCPSGGDAPSAGAADAAAAPTAKASASTARTSEASCSEQTRALGSWLEQLGAEGDFDPSSLSRTLELVHVDQAPAWIDDAPSVEILEKQVLVDGTLAGSPKVGTDELKKALKEKRELALKLRGAVEAPVAALLSVDRRAPWSGVAAAVRAVEDAGYERVTFVFAARPSTMAPPPGSSARAEASVDPSKPAPVLSASAAARPADSLFAGCPAALELMPSILASGHKKAQSARIAHELPGAIDRCACKADLGAVRAFFWSWHGRPGGVPRFGVTIPLAGPTDKNAPELSAGGDAPWSETYKLVAAAGQGARRFTAK